MKFLLKLFTIFIFVGCFFIHTEIGYAAREDTSLRVKEESGYARLDISPKILDKNVIIKTSFELFEEKPSLLNSLSDGQQSFGSWEWLLGGEHSLKIKQTTPDKGNLSKDSDTSVAVFENRRYIEDGKYVTISMYILNNKETTIVPMGYGGNADKQITLQEGLNSPVPFKFSKRTYLGLSYFYVTNPEVLNEYIKKQNVYIASKSSTDGDYDYGLIKSVNTSNGKVDVDEAFDQVFKEGEDVIMHRDVTPIKFEPININTNNEWERVSFTSKVDGLGIYNTLNRGFTFNIHTKTEDNTYIDDFTLSYATKHKILRNNEVIYEGFTTTYRDKEAIDKTAPNKVSNVKLSESNNNLLVSWDKSLDNGTNYSYKIETYDLDNNLLDVSKNKDIKITSNEVTYLYSISSKKEKPLNNIANNQILLDKNIYNDTDYLNIQAVDKNGNLSEVYSIQLKKLINEDNEHLLNSLIKNDTIDLNLDIPFLDTFGTMIFKSYKYKTNIHFNDDFVITNTVDEHWYITLESEPFKVRTFDGFIGTPYELPYGSMTLGKLINLKSKNEYLPNILHNEEKMIDTNETINILSSTEETKMGIFSFNFEYLSLVIDPTTMKVDLINYPDEPTPYETVLKWNIIYGP